jgi:hypothetical protein
MPVNTPEEQGPVSLARDRGQRTKRGDYGLPGGGEAEAGAECLEPVRLG